MSDTLKLLPGVPADYVHARLSATPGNEIESGKFQSPDSSAALAVNAFAWFHHQPDLLPPMPGTQAAGWPATRVEVEYCARFPWRGGRHPWLDAFIETTSCIIGVESKRHEPFRDEKRVSFSDAYDRAEWGKRMRPYESMRDMLRSRRTRFVHLDAAQLLKHAFGLVTEASRREGKVPMLVYLYAEPACWPAAHIARHREEVAAFARSVDGAAVSFSTVRWTDWLGSWPAHDARLVAHRQQLIERFEP